MHICRGANLTSLLFMNVCRIYIYIVCFSSPIIDEWQKGGEWFGFIYACYLCLCIYMFYVYSYAYVIMILISKALIAYPFYWYLNLHVYFMWYLSFLNNHMHVFYDSYCILICYCLLVIKLHWMSICLFDMHELRGSFYELIFNPCIYDSMSFVIIKKREIVGPKAHHSSFDDD